MSLNVTLVGSQRQPCAGSGGDMSMLGKAGKSFTELDLFSCREGCVVCVCVSRRKNTHKITFRGGMETGEMAP